MIRRGFIALAVLAYVITLGCVVWSGGTSSPHTGTAAADEPAAPTTFTADLPFKGAGMQIQRMDWIDKYKQSIDEIAAIGCDTVSLVLDSRMETGTSTRIYLDMRMTPTPEKLADLIQHAKSKGLRVIIMPIVLLDNPQGNDWRGTIRPSTETGGWEDWFDSYRNMLIHFAWIAEQNHADVLVIGSELVSAENKADEWERTIKAVRKVFHGRLTYSSNWDHYTSVPFWDQLDLMGLNSYWALDEDPPGSHNHMKNKVTVDQIVENWKYIQQDLLAFQKKINKPLLFTEVGWCSLANAAHESWDYTKTDEPLDMDLQKRLYEGFFKAWHGNPALGGFVVWEWTPGDGAKDYPGHIPTDTPDETLNRWKGYTPEGKPAEQVLKDALAKPWK
jgi:hypothetical protein